MKKNENIFLKTGRAIIFCAARFLFFAVFRTKISYINNKGRKSRYKGPCVFVSNHTNICDGILLSILLQYNNVHALVAKDWFERKKLRWILKQGRCYPIDRYKRDFSWLHNSLKALKGGESILIFPEGGISRTGIMKEFKSGFILLAEKAKVPIIPIAVTREYRLFGKRQHIVIGEPYWLEKTEDSEKRSEYMNEKAEYFRKRIDELKNINIS